MAHDLDLLELAAAWRSEGRRVALATVVATWGSSPWPPGSQLLADNSGRFMGSVSGGCIEGEVVRRTRKVIETGEPALLDFGHCQRGCLVCGAKLRRPDPGFRRASQSNEA
jgi:xanthine/CO dehydrogenase XdhC/CoxF family maturation factor